MINLLKTIVETITAVISFFIHTITSLFHFLQQIPTYLTFVTTSINVLPDVILPFAIAGLSISVVLFVLNRRGG